jgi:hypothetical protein
VHFDLPDVTLTVRVRCDASDADALQADLVRHMTEHVEWAWA